MAVTIHDIANKVGVSKTTVYRALNNKPRISKETYDLIIKTAQELNYFPNKLASGLRSKRSMAIGLIFNDLISGHFFSDIFNGIEDSAIQNDYGVILGCSNGDPHKEKLLLNLFAERQVDGIIVAPTYGVDTECYRRLQEERIPFVFIDKYIPEIATDIVTTDDFFGSYEAVSHLIRLGHRNIAILIGPEYPCSTIEKRIEGYRKALRDNRLEHEGIISFTEKMTNQRKYGYLAVGRYLAENESKNTAIFAINDSLAIGALKALREHNLRVPADVAVIGYNNDEIDEYLDIQLTTVLQPKYEMGKKAMELLLKRINRDKEAAAPATHYEYINLRPQLIIRDSCGSR
ncbi:LacI family transcriptional regulator [Hydrogenispora ethanolica]|jgi:LacI family transcriptional regulator|uniref:LacI family transcriptional regulator n=1 Tax=Hydrogenispora ethanolica TaxID=1082276 RepID=A0A4R1RIK7_HYDET|nr:LacI family DNA-binding transcriptional regulator [Hydrogenispora ethanolica]TCL65931.1 LacI family transcriptional regulator [Hydrogenispora ethanolica]